MMKKKFAVAVCLSMALMLAACGSDAKSAAEQNSQAQSTQPQAAQDSSIADTAASEDSAAEEAVDGGWEVNSGSLAMKDNKEAEAVFKKAIDGLTGCDYEPVALLGSQVVAGTNYCILCRTAAVVPDPQYSYSLVRIYADLDGNAKVTGETPLDISGGAVYH